MSETLKNESKGGVLKVIKVVTKQIEVIGNDIIYYSSMEIIIIAIICMSQLT